MMDQESERKNPLKVRLTDVVECATNNNPISGLELVPMESLDSAIKYAQTLDPDLQQYRFEMNLHVALKAARDRIRTHPHAVANDTMDVLGLSQEEIAAIHLYTQNTPLYLILNSRMRDKNRHRLRPVMAYIKLLLSGLYKLPPVKALVYRGVNLDLHAEFPYDYEPMW